tara:strand:- start:500 stop:682 length:183 start_codon:yes stop_codon:yes gene_type:complete
MNGIDRTIRLLVERIEKLEKTTKKLEKKLGMIGDYTHLSLERPEEIIRDGDGKLLSDSDA